MPEPESKRIVLVVGGGIAAYKSAILCSRLVQSGHEVQAVMTASATQFLGAATLAALSGRPVAGQVFSGNEHPLGPHIALARRADLLCVAPATADLLAKAADLNAMTIGDETASTLGIPVARFRLVVFVVGALITGVMVAFSGIIGCVGLMIPHIARFLVGGSYNCVLPASLLLGAIFLIWADILARTVMAPEDMPIGIVTGLVGGIFFVWLLSRRQA